MIKFDDVITSNTSDKKLTYAEQIWSNSKNDFIENIINELSDYGHIAEIPNWNNLKNLTINSTSDDIIQTLKLRDIKGSTITEASKINEILGYCSIRGKWIIEKTYSSKIQVEYISNFYVLTRIGNIPYFDENKEFKVRPILSTICLQYNNTGLKIIDICKNYTLYKCNNI